MPNRNEYLNVTFLEDVVFGGLITVPAGTTLALVKDVARGLSNRSVRINGQGDPSTTPTLGALGASSPVTVAGTPGVGNVLTAVVSTGWSVTGYQWKRDGSAISGATSSTYLQASADAGHVLTLSVSGLIYTPSGVTVPGGGGGGSDIWDDTVTWLDTSTWVD